MALSPEAFSAPPILLDSGAANRTARNATALMLSAILTKGLLFLWQIYLARSLGVGEYGVYGTISALMIIGATIPDFGMGMIVIREVASHPQDAGRYLAVTLTAQPILAAAGYLALTLTAIFLGYSSGLRALLALAAFSLLIDALGNMAYNQLIALERMVATAVISIVHTAVLVILGVAALAANTGLWGLYAAILVAGAFRVIAHWAVLRRAGVRPAFPPGFALTSYAFANGAPFALNAFLSLAYIHSDKLLATAIIGTQGTGQLLASFVIVFGVMELLGTPMLVTVFPLMSRLHHEDSQEKFTSLLERLSFFTLLAGLPLAFLTSLLAQPLSTWFFGGNYLGAAAVLRIMIWYAVAAMLSNVFSQALAVQNRQRWLLALRLGGLAMSIALNLILLPRLGISGTPIAMVCTELVILMLILRSLSLPAEWWQRIVAHTWRVGLAALALAGVILLFRTAHPLLAALAGLSTFTVVVIISGAITEQDRAMITRLIIAAPGGARFIQFWNRKETE